MIARFFRSDAMSLRGGEVPERTIEAEWFQLTYDVLRTAPDGELVASFDSQLDVWVTLDEGTSYSDIVIA